MLQNYQNILDLPCLYIFYDHGIIFIFNCFGLTDIVYNNEIFLRKIPGICADIKSDYFGFTGTYGPKLLAKA